MHVSRLKYEISARAFYGWQKQKCAGSMKSQLSYKRPCHDMHMLQRCTDALGTANAGRFLSYDQCSSADSWPDDPTQRLDSLALRMHQPVVGFICNHECYPSNLVPIFIISKGLI